MNKIIKNLGWLFLELLVFIILFLIVGAILYFGIRWISRGDYNILSKVFFNEQTNPYGLLLSSFFPVLISGLIASILTQYYIFKRPFIVLGYNKPFWSMFGKGWLWSIALILPGFLVLVLFQQIDLLQPTWNANYFLGFILFFIIQSGGEEVLTRTFLINLVETRFGLLLAVILSASLFAIMHLGNDHFSFLGFINILLGGSIMALFFILYRNIWICIGLHAGWNFIQAVLFDFNVSGIDVYSFIQFQNIGYSRLTGSDFGYEGSLLAVLFQLAGLIFLIKKNKDELSILLFPEPPIPADPVNPANFDTAQWPQQES